MGGFTKYTIQHSKETKLSSLPKKKSTDLDVNTEKPITFSLGNKNDEGDFVRRYIDTDDTEDWDRDQKLKRTVVSCKYKPHKEGSPASSQQSQEAIISALSGYHMCQNILN